jgi:hypothetical protein
MNKFLSSTGNVAAATGEFALAAADILRRERAAIEVLGRWSALPSWPQFKGALSLTQNPEKPKPATRAGHNFPARPGINFDLDNRSIPDLAPKFKRHFGERGNACPRLTWRASAKTEEHPAIVQ